MSTVSVWTGDATLPRPAALQENLTVDVCIIGAGMAGLSAAYMLGKEGLSVAVLEKRTPRGR